MIKRILFSVCTLGVLFFVVFWFAQHDAVDNSNNIEFIKSHCYNGKIIDMQNEISIRSSDDVKWYYDKYETIVIEYGKVLLKYKTKDFITEEAQTELNDIFITVKQHPETYALTLFFKGEELPEYVKK